jgi:hypothetical protein
MSRPRGGIEIEKQMIGSNEQDARRLGCVKGCVVNIALNSHVKAIQCRLRKFFVFLSLDGGLFLSKSGREAAFQDQRLASRNRTRLFEQGREGLWRARFRPPTLI